MLLPDWILHEWVWDRPFPRRLLLIGLAAGLLVRESQAFELGLRAELVSRARSFAADTAQRAGALVAEAAGDGAGAIRAGAGRA